MNIIDIQLDLQDSETGYAQLFDVVAEITGVTPKQGYSLVKIVDFTGREAQALIRGRTQPTQNDVGSVKMFSLSAGTKGNYVNYSGFYNPKDTIPPQYQGKRPPQAKQTQQNTTGSGSKKSGGVSGNQRGFALSYAKDLAVAGVITMKQLKGVASQFDTYLVDGVWQGTGNTSAPTQQPEQEIPATDEGNFVGDEYTEPGNTYTNEEQPVGTDFGEDSPF